MTWVEKMHSKNFLMVCLDQYYGFMGEIRKDISQNFYRII